MNCYKHRELQSIAVCQWCGRGLCSECVKEVGDRVACAGSCEGKVGSLNIFMDQNVASRSLTRSYAATAWLYLGLGCFFAFISFGGYIGAFKGENTNFSQLILCVVTGIIAFASFRLWWARAFRKS